MCALSVVLHLLQVPGGWARRLLGSRRTTAPLTVAGVEGLAPVWPPPVPELWAARGATVLAGSLPGVGRLV